METSYGATGVSLARAQVALAILCLLYILSFVDRQALTMLVEPIKREFGASDTQMALLQGLAFILIYSVVGLKVGDLVDRRDRPKIICVGICIWSVATIACGLAPGFAWLFIARILVGIGEACLNPAAYSLIAEYFDGSRRGRAYAVFGAAGSAGGALALLLSGGLMHVLGNTPEVHTPMGSLALWRTIFVLVGLPGIVFALMVRFLPEPRRSAVSLRRDITADTPDVTEAPQPIRSGVIIVLIMFSLLFLAGHANAVWVISGYVRHFGISVEQAGVSMGLIMLGSTIVGAYFGGWIGDRWTVRRLRGMRLRFVAIGSAVLVPVSFCWWSVNDLVTGYVLATIYYFLIAALMTSGPAVLNEILPPQLRGRISAAYLLVTGVVGVAIGPLLVGLASDHLFSSSDGLARALSIIPSAAAATAGVIAWLNLDRYGRLVRPLDQQ